MKLLLLLSLIFASAAQASLPYKWDKNIGDSRFERGSEDEKKLSEIKKDGIFRLTRSCENGEVLITGGCSSAYGMFVTSSFPFTSSVPGSKTEWVCVGEPRPETALTTAGNRPTADTPATDLVGDLMVVIVCEKRI